MEESKEVIDESPTKEDILSAIPVRPGDNVSMTIDAHIKDNEPNLDIIEQTSKITDIERPQEVPEIIPGPIEPPQIEEKPEYIERPKIEERYSAPKRTIVRDAKGRIVEPIPQKTNKNGNAGRKPVIDENVLKILRQAFLAGATDQEAAEWADIHVATLYNYQVKHPEFIEEKEAWKTNPIMKARISVYNSLEDPRIAAWFLERKKKDEFSTRTEHTGKDGEDLPPIKLEYVSPTESVRVNKDPLRGDSEAASSVDAVDGPGNK